MTGQHRIEDLLREFAPQVLGAMVRRHGQFDACEDAVQEALLAAAQQWPTEGVPDRPRSWLLTVAGRALVDGWRADSARRRRETAVALDPTDHAPAADHDAHLDRPVCPAPTGTTRLRCCSCAATPLCRHPRSSRSPCGRSAA